MSPAEQKLRRDVALGAMQRLAEGKALSRIELFSDPRLKGSQYRKQDDWQRRLMRFLETQEIVVRSGGISGRYVTYQLSDCEDAPTRLQAVSTSEDLGVVLFTETMPNGDEREQEQEQEQDQPLIEVEPSVAAKPSTDDLRLDFAIKLMAAVLENVVYVREHLDKVEARQEALEKNVEELVRQLR